VIQNSYLLSKHKMPVVPTPACRLTHSFIISVLQLILLVLVTCIYIVQQLDIMARRVTHPLAVTWKQWKLSFFPWEGIWNEII